MLCKTSTNKALLNNKIVSIQQREKDSYDIYICSVVKFAANNHLYVTIHGHALLHHFSHLYKVKKFSMSLLPS